MWYIVGHGSLASLWAHSLQRAGEKVTIVLRNGVNNLEQPNELALTLEREEKIRNALFPCVHWQSLRNLDLSQAQLLVMVKAWQVEEVLHEVTCLPMPPRAIILSHNGLGAAEKLVAQRPDLPIYDLITTHGAWRRTPTHVVHAGVGTSLIGRRNAGPATCQRPPDWFNPLADACPPLNWEPEILLRRWHKLAINCAINPLASLADQPNAVLQEPEYADQISTICAEVSAVANAVFAENLFTTEKLERAVYEVIEATAANSCSMLQDLRHGRPTEILYLNGYISQLALNLGIPAPVNAALTEAILARSKR